ncbi:hypothetical protein J5N97_012218 [Dioscorea zingiberensis]|uniref:Transcription initiation factor TFIID subunit 12 domain-containing protein n=1 Tax=Dioscorea zingiberensis TaxID=325984 RepID=A0A9D5HHK6_9LILI|nr:hypothetical protein J5N97_012218 [Dioscorea zingiberensis]
MDGDEKPAAASAPPPVEPPPPPPSTAPPVSTATPPQISASSAPSTTEIPPASTISSSAAPIPPQSQQSQQATPRPPIAASRPQGPFPHFSSHIPATSSAATPSAPIQRGGMAIGVPAHHPRPHQPGQTFFSPSTTFTQPFSSLHRPDQSPMSTAQARQPVPGIQTIGMIGSISSGSQMRLSGVAGQHQQRLGQPAAKSVSPAANQSLSTQKFQTHGLSRPSMAPSSTPTSGAQTPQTLEQQWMAAQGKQLQASPSSSYRPQLKQQVPQQRPHLSQQHQHSLQSTLLQQQQQQQQKNLPLHLQQMQSQQAALPNQSQEHNQQYLPSRNQPMLPPQQAARAQLSVQQKSNIPASLQSAAVQTGAISSVFATDAESGNQILSKRSIRDLVTQIDPSGNNQILSKRSIRDLVTQIDPSEKLDPEVEDILVEIAEDFIESITTFGCSLAKHRKSTTLEAKDILLHVERNWNMTLPGFSGDEIKCYKKPFTNDIHKERLAVIKKSMVGSERDSGNTKNPASAQAAANSKSHAAKPPPIHSPKT